MTITIWITKAQSVDEHGEPVLFDDDDAVWTVEDDGGLFNDVDQLTPGAAAEAVAKRTESYRSRGFDVQVVR